MLSPLLFSLAFSIIWEKLNTSPFPGKDYVFRSDDFWLIAFADNLVVVASSLQKANEVLTQLITILKDFDLEFSAVKLEGMVFTPGGRCSSFDTLSTSLHLGNESLKIVGSFKYLGTWIKPSLKFGAHLAAVEERSRLASLQTVKLAYQLNITEPHRYAVLYRAFIESQLYGMELFPATAEPVIHRIRRLFLEDLYTGEFPPTYATRRAHHTETPCQFSQSSEETYSTSCGEDTGTGSKTRNEVRGLVPRKLHSCTPR